MLKDSTGAQRAYGVYRGIVVDNKDPQNNGRIRIKVPQLFHEEPTEWAWPSFSATGRQKAPTVGQGVWVMFEGGDVAFPIWVGVFGKNQGPGNNLLLRQLAAGESLSGITSYIITAHNADGSIEVDVTASMLAMAHTIATQQSQIASLSSRITALGG